MTASRICSGRRSARPADVEVADSGKTGEELTVWDLRTLIEQMGCCQRRARKWNSRKKAQKAQTGMAKISARPRCGHANQASPRRDFRHTCFLCVPCALLRLFLMPGGVGYPGVTRLRARLAQGSLSTPWRRRKAFRNSA